MQARIQEQDRVHAEQTAALHAQLEAQDRRMAEMMLIMQQLRQKTGVPVQLTAPSGPTATATPVSVKL